VSGLVEAARFNWAYQAELFRIFLEQHGVEGIVFDTQASFYADGAITGVRVMVLDEDLPEAERLFVEYEA
jgi:Putative prokaryotic signal transducing protein